MWYFFYTPYGTLGVIILLGALFGLFSKNSIVKICSVFVFILFGLIMCKSCFEVQESDKEWEIKRRKAEDDLVKHVKERQKNREPEPWTKEEADEYQRRHASDNK